MQYTPDSFDFYHLGRVERIDRREPTDIDFTSRVGVSFRLYGEGSDALVVLLFSECLDVSVYTEMGNVLAGRIAAETGAAAHADYMISPPRFLDGTQLERQLLPVLKGLEVSGNVAIPRQYEHRLEGVSIALQLLVLPAATQGYDS